MSTATALADTDAALRHAEQMRLMLDFVLQHESTVVQALFNPSQNTVSLYSEEDGDSIVVPYDDILYCLVREHFSELYYHIPTLDETVQKSLHNKPLKYWERMLPTSLFVKVNKSCIINSKHVHAVER